MLELCKLFGNDISYSTIVFHLDLFEQGSAKMERPTTRKQTRGTKIKKSVHITGKRADGSTESESEPEDADGNKNKK